MRCECCGRFFSGAKGYAWKMIYSGHPPMPDHEIYRCPACVVTHGMFAHDERIRPECSCGYKSATALVEARDRYAEVVSK